MSAPSLNRSRFEFAGTRASILVGRDEEFRTLERALAAARAGHGQAVFLVGEGGVGKSRLAVEAGGHAFATGMRLLRGRGSTIGPIVPFRPLTEALLSLRRAGELPEAGELGPYLPVLGRLVPDWSREAAGDGTGQGGDMLVVLAEAVIRLTAVIGRGRGCLLVLDDLQDADAETLAVVEYLVDNLGDQPTVLLGTVRDEPCAALEVARAAVQRRACTIVELGRLGHDEVRRIAASCLDGEPGEVPPAVLERLWADSAGNPLLVEELLSGMVASGVLVCTPQGWRVVGELRAEMPRTLARSVVRRADQLGAQGRRLLSMAAVIGPRFPVAVVQAATGLDDRSLLSHLRAGLEAQLVTSDDQAPDWYAFQHPLTAEALLSDLLPAYRADLAHRAADAVEALYPGLPGEWCQLAATLRLDAGDPSRAGRLFAEAGRRAVAQGAANSAVTLLDRARDLLAGEPDAGLVADVVECLVQALTEAGLIGRALTLTGTLGEVGGGIDRRRRAAMHARLAWAANVAGRVEEAATQVAAARALLGPHATTQELAPLDVVDAYLALDLPGSDRLATAATLARRAATVADEVPLPVVGCQAWQLLGVLARPADIDESTACFERARQIAREHHLPVWEIHALIRLGGNDALLTADLTRLEQARDAAVRAGAVTASYDAEVNLAMQAVLRGGYATAGATIDACMAAAERLHLIDTAQYVLLTRAVLAAHQGRRRDMDRALADFRGWGGDRSQHAPLAFGLARAFCALLEDDSERARHELAEAYALESANPTIFYLTGRYGLRLLLGVLAGTADEPDYEAVASTAPARLRWNRHFVTLAHAVLLGRAGHADRATAAVAQAQHVGVPYPMARHLGLRLVAQAAHADGWGTPDSWLYQAEDYFHRGAVPTAAAACRALLRKTGAPVPQRRGGTDGIPTALRSMGVTHREYEVLQLLPDRPTNRIIADLLHISPRTAEKHVANLIVKTGQPDRSTLCAVAPTMLGG